VSTGRSAGSSSPPPRIRHGFTRKDAILPRQPFRRRSGLTDVEPSRHDGLAQLHQRYYPELVRLAFALTGDWSLAEELGQEAFVRAWRSWDTIRRKQSAPAYLRATVINLARTSLRQRLREIRAWRDVAIPRQAEAAVSPDVLHALARLPPRKRECVVLRYYLDLSEADTAAALGISVGTVKSQTARALQRLRPLLSDGGAPSVTPLPGNEGGP
jgi:RNA polymerase sigma-70 factor (sigma-E family)